MRRLVLCVMSVVLVVGMLPLPAFAGAGGGAARLRSGAVSTTGALVPAGDFAVGPADATFADANLYKAVIDQLDELGIAYTANESAKNVKLAAEDNARFTRLNACHRHIKDLSGLEAFTGLKWVDLSNNLVSTSSQFAGMKNLSYLDLYDNAVRDLSGLRDLAKLEHLNLGDNDEVSHTSMTGLDAIDTLASLTWLDFSRNQTPEITEHIKDLVSLTHLNLMDENLKDVYDLAGLTNMKTLILNHNNGIAGISSLAGMTELEELHVAFTHLNMSYVKDGVEQYGEDKSGINALFNDDGSLKLKKLRKIDLLADWNTGFATDGKAPSEANQHVRELYRMFKAGELEEYGYFYTWFDYRGDPNYMRTAGIMHTDPDTGVKYIAYDDFDPHCDGIRDDFYAFFNAHQYANTFGCEVRATVGGANAGAAKQPYHFFNYYNTRDLVAYTNVDWQNAQFVFHDEHIDHYPSRHKQMLLLYTSPQGSVKGTSLYEKMKTINAPTLNEGWSLNTGSRSFKGVSPQVDEAIAALKQDGYSRLYVMVTNKNKRQYRRHEGIGDINWNGFDQWDAFIINGDGAIEEHNASEMLPHGEAELSAADYHSPTPSPVQWDFGDITKVEIVPIPDEQSHVRNGRFTTMPLASKAETPRDGGGKPADYRRCLDFRYSANLEVSNITQTVGFKESGYDNNNLSGSYYGFITMSSCADVDMHDCAVWDRRAITSTYGYQLDKIVNIRLTRASESNPFEHLLAIGGNRWGVTGNNHIKHILYDNCVLSRIDAHMGYYDLAVRDCTLGFGGFALTGQGPLTVERTCSYSRSFMNLRSDYGSTWDGDAHIIDCTHYAYRTASSSGEPRNFSASTAKFTDAAQENRHDFGYPLRHPRLYLKNFTLDERYFSGWTTNYSLTYGIIANYINGLEKYDDYWPDVVDIDGLHMVNYEDKLGYESHVRMPLKMYGPVLEVMKKGGYSVRDVTYNGKPLAADLTQGTSLFDEPFNLKGRGAGTTDPWDRSVSREPTCIAEARLSFEQLGTNDVVIEYTGDEPYICLADATHHRDPYYIIVYPYFVEHRASSEVAYFSSAEVNRRWADHREKYADAQLGPYDYFSIRTAPLEKTIGGDTISKVTEGKTQLLNVKLLGTHERCEHQWGEWQQVWAPTCTVPGQEQRICGNDASHVQTREVAATGHDWGEWKVTTPATCETAGVEVRACKRNSSHVETRELAPTGHDWAEWKVTTPATCTDAGIEARTCKHDSSHIETREVVATGHDWGEWEATTPATCTAAGIDKRVCKNDSSHVEMRIAAALGHDWESHFTTDVAPTTTHEGSESIHCMRCDATKDARVIARLVDPNESSDTGLGAGAGTGTGSGSDGSDVGSKGESGTGAKTGTGSGSKASLGSDSKAGASSGASASAGTTPKASAPKRAAKRTPVKPVFGLARAKTGQRFYTTSSSKAVKLARSRWRLQGVAFYAPTGKGKKVWQLKKSGRYVYTAKAREVARFKKKGWKATKASFSAVSSGGVKVYRLRNKKTGAYLLTDRAAEVKALKKAGWKSQGAAFRAVG